MNIRLNAIVSFPLTAAVAVALCGCAELIPPSTVTSLNAVGEKTVSMNGPSPRPKETQGEVDNGDRPCIGPKSFQGKVIDCAGNEIKSSPRPRMTSTTVNIHLPSPGGETAPSG